MSLQKSKDINCLQKALKHFSVLFFFSSLTLLHQIFVFWFILFLFLFILCLLYDQTNKMKRKKNNNNNNSKYCIMCGKKRKLKNVPYMYFLVICIFFFFFHSAHNSQPTNVFAMLCYTKLTYFTTHSFFYMFQGLHNKNIKQQHIIQIPIYNFFLLPYSVCVCVFLFFADNL